MVNRRSTSDALQEAVGDFGCWQAGISLLMALLKIPVAWFQLSIIILEAHTDFWCARPHNLYSNLTVEEWKNLSHPRMENGGYDACWIYDLNYTSDHVGDAAEKGGTVACQNWEYSRAVFKENIVTEWNLVCSHSMLANIAQATFMLGVLLGNIVFGTVADRMGRKVPLIISIGLQAGAGLLSSFSPWFSLFLVGRFVTAVATGGTMVISFVLVMEIVGQQWRSTIAVLYQIPFSIGICLMAGISYLQRDWRDFHFTLSALSVLFIVYWWFTSESPRWLLAVGREKEAIRILENAARWNGRDVSAVKDLVQRLRPDRQVQNSDKKATLADLMRTPNLRRNTLTLFVVWFLAGLTFYGFSQSLSMVAGDIFVTTVIVGSVGVPGILLCVYFIRFGRRNLMFISQIVAGAACLLLTVIPAGMFPGDWPRIILSTIALTGMCFTIPVAFVFSGEIFPTVVRNVGLGSACMFSRLGSVLAPFIKSTETFGAFWPPLILGCCLLLTAVAVAFLPETKNCRLPDTLQDGEQFAKECVPDKENGNYIVVSQLQA